MRGGRLSGWAVSAPLHGDRARGGGGEGNEPVERLQRRAAAHTTEGVERAVVQARGGVGCIEGKVIFEVEADDEGGAEVGEEGSVEGGAEVAAAVEVDVVVPPGRRDGVVVRGLEEEELAWDESDDFAVDGAATRRIVRCIAC